jgi:hypothetical protein
VSKKIEMFFFDYCGVTDTDIRQREYDYYTCGDFPLPITRTQIPPPGYGAPPATPFGKNTSRRFEYNSTELEVWMSNSIQECLE